MAGRLGKHEGRHFFGRRLGLPKLCQRCQASGISALALQYPQQTPDSRIANLIYTLRQRADEANVGCRRALSLPE